MSESVVLAGASAPEALELIITSTGLDLTTVTAVSAVVVRGDASTATWSFSITAATASSLTALHLFDVSDVPDPDMLTLRIRLTTPGGTRRALPRRLRVVPEVP